MNQKKKKKMQGSHSAYTWFNLKFMITRTACLIKLSYVVRACLVAQSHQTLGDSLKVAWQAPLSMGFPGKNAGVSCHFLHQVSYVYIYFKH